MEPSQQRTNAEVLEWQIVFSEAVRGVTVDDFSLIVFGGEPVQASVDFVGDEGTDTYQVFVNDIMLTDGEVSLVLSGVHGIEDLNDNALIGDLPRGAETCILDHTPPMVESVTRMTPAREFTNENILTWLVTFSEEVTGVDADGSDFVLTSDPAGEHGWRMESAVATDTGRAWLVTATGNDSYAFTLGLASAGTLSDVSGNDLSDRNVRGVSESCTFDDDPPEMEDLRTENGDTVIRGAEAIIFEFNEPVVGFEHEDITISVLFSATASPDPGTLGPLIRDPRDDTIYRAVYTRSADFLSGSVKIAISRSSLGDRAGNPFTSGNSGTFTLPALTDSPTDPQDTTAPTITSVKRLNPPANDVLASVAKINRTPANELTSASNLVWEVVFSEEVTGVDADDFTLLLASGVAGMAAINVAGAGDTCQVSASGGDIDAVNGRVGLRLEDDHDIEDAAKNALRGGLPEDAELYLLDNSPPILPSVTRVPLLPQRTGADQLRWHLNFQEALANLEIKGGDFGSGGYSQRRRVRRARRRACRHVHLHFQQAGTRF